MNCLNLGPSPHSSMTIHMDPWNCSCTNIPHQQHNVFFRWWYRHHIHYLKPHPLEFQLFFPSLHVFLCAHDNLVYDWTPLMLLLSKHDLFSHLAFTLNASDAIVVHQEVLGPTVLLPRWTKWRCLCNSYTFFYDWALCRFHKLFF